METQFHILIAMGGLGLKLVFSCFWIYSCFINVEGSWYLQTKQESTSFLVSDLPHDIREGEVNLWSQDINIRNPTLCDQWGPSTDDTCDNGLRGRRAKPPRKAGLIRISLYRTRYPLTACRRKPCANGVCTDNGSNSSYQCTCNRGWTSKNCDKDIDECLSNPCHPNNTISCTNRIADYRCNCRPGYNGRTCGTEINECNSGPCKNGATCTDHVAAYTCTCVPGFTGNNCEQNIDECISSPCQNGATCKDFVNHFRCSCAQGFYGVLCDTNVCRPLPADVVFVLDSSVSMTETQFKTQLEFVSNFTDQIRLGPRDFQLSVITYSFDAHIEFYLDEYRDNVTIKEAIGNITYKPGVTNTHLALEAVKEVFGPGHGGDKTRYNNTMADRFVYLMTDGLASVPGKAELVANKLKNNLGIAISTIGIGLQVCHDELYEIASKNGPIASVYSVRNFNSLYTVLKQLVHYSCDECTRSKKSDIAIVMDTSTTMTDVQDQISKNALAHLIGGMEIGDNETQLSFTTFDTKINHHFDFHDHTETNDIIPVINSAPKSSEASLVDITDVIHDVRVNVLPKGRHDARSFILLVTNGNFSQHDAVNLKAEKTALNHDGVEMIVVGTGDEVIVESLLALASDPFNVYIANDGAFDKLDVIKSYFEYSECDLS